MMVATNNLHGLNAGIPKKFVLRRPDKLRPAATTSNVTGGPIFTDPKLNAMREAAVAGDWEKLFRIQPRGCLRSIDHGLSRMDGTYGQCAEPSAYGVDAADHPQGRHDYLWWLQNNPLRKQLTINDLRYKKDASGRVVKVPYTRAELERYYNNFTLSKGQWPCAPAQIQRYINTAMSGSHPGYPIALCAQTSQSRRKKVLKKVAAVGAAVTGAVLFGPAIIGKVGGALKTGAGAIGAAARGAAGVAAGVGRVGALAARSLPAAVNVLNGVATVNAIRNGQMPPPPISIGDGNFTDYASLVAQQLAQRELGSTMDAAQQAELAYMIELERRRMAAVEPRHLPVVNTGLNPVLTASQRGRADAALSEGNLLKYAAVGIPLALLAMRAMR